VLLSFFKSNMADIYKLKPNMLTLPVVPISE